MVVTRIYFYRLSNGKSTLSVSLGPIVSPLIYASKDVMASNFEAPLSIMWMTTKMLPNFNNKCCVSCLVSNKRSPSGHRETKKKREAQCLSCSSCGQENCEQKFVSLMPQSHQTFPSMSDREIVADYVEK